MTRYLLAHWPWMVAAAVVLAALSVACRGRVARLVRLGKALATDKRLPRPVRLMFAAALAIKTVPLPDFGVDEVLLLVGALLLAGPYRATWLAIREETR